MRTLVRALRETVSPTRLALIAAVPIAPMVVFLVVQAGLDISRIDLPRLLEIWPIGIIPVQGLVQIISWSFAMGSVLSLVGLVSRREAKSNLRRWRPWCRTAVFCSCIVLGGCFAALVVMNPFAFLQGGGIPGRTDERWGMALWRFSIVVAGWEALTSMGPPDQEVEQAKESLWLWSIGIVAATVVMPWLLPACGLEFIGDDGRSRRGYVELLRIYGQTCICMFGVMWLGALWTTPPAESDA